MDIRFVILCLGLVGGLLGCGLPSKEKPSAKFISDKLLVVTATNFETGALAVFDPFSLKFDLKFSPISSDAVPKKVPGYSDIFVINRLGNDNIQRVEKSSGRTVSQFSVGRGTNPQDMVRSGEKVFVSLFEKPYLLEWNIQEGTGSPAVDLTAFSDADGVPEASRLQVFGNKIWIQLQKLNRLAQYEPTDSSVIAVLNPAESRIESTIQLMGVNPVTAMKMGADGYVLVGSAGFVGGKSKLDGGIEKIDPVNKKSLGFIAQEKDLGGDIVDFECLTPGSCVAIIASPETQFISFDPVTGQRLRTLWKSEGYHLRQILRDGEKKILYVADANPFNPLIRVWSEEDLMEQKHLNWKLELPPYQMEWF